MCNKEREQIWAEETEQRCNYHRCLNLSLRWALELSWPHRVGLNWGRRQGLCTLRPTPNLARYWLWAAPRKGVLLWVKWFSLLAEGSFSRGTLLWAVNVLHSWRNECLAADRGHLMGPQHLQGHYLHTAWIRLPPVAAQGFSTPALSKFKPGKLCGGGYPVLQDVIKSLTPFLMVDHWQLSSPTIPHPHLNKL